MPERDIEAAAMTMDVSLGERTHRCGYLGPWHGIATQRTAAHTMPLSANTHHDRPEQSLDLQLGWLNGLAIAKVLLISRPAHRCVGSLGLVDRRPNAGSSTLSNRLIFVDALEESIR